MLHTLEKGTWIMLIFFNTFMTFVWKCPGIIIFLKRMCIMLLDVVVYKSKLG